MTNSVDPQSDGSPNVWRSVPAAAPPLVGSQQWRSPAMSAVPSAHPPGSAHRPPMPLPAAFPATTVRPLTGPRAVPAGRRRLIDRSLFWYLLLVVALLLLLVSFWVWNEPTDAQLGMLSSHAGGPP